MVATEPDTGSRMDWIVFSEETADRAREDLRGLDQKIWNSPAATVLIALFLVTQLKQSPLAADQLRSAGKLLAGVVLGYDVIHSFGAVRFTPRFLASRDERLHELIARGAPLMVAQGIAFTTVLVLALMSTDYQASETLTFYLLNVIPLLTLLVMAVVPFAVALLLIQDPLGVSRFFGEPAAKTASRVLSPVLFVGLIVTARYAIGGVAGLVSHPPDWIAFLEVFAGGTAFIAFFLWMGALFADRNLAADRLHRLEEFHYEVSRGKSTAEEASLLYARVLEAEAVRVLLGLFPEASVNEGQG